MPDAKQLRLSFPEKQLLLPLADPLDKPSQIGEDLVDVIDLNADESIYVLYGTPLNPADWGGFPNVVVLDEIDAVHDYDAEIDF